MFSYRSSLILGIIQCQRSLPESPRRLCSYSEPSRPRSLVC